MFGLSCFAVQPALLTLAIAVKNMTSKTALVGQNHMSINKVGVSLILFYRNRRYIADRYVIKRIGFLTAATYYSALSRWLCRPWPGDWILGAE